MLEVENLSIRLQLEHTNFTAVDNISFSIDSGEVLALIGESGSGKSMTALSIMRLLPNTAAYSKHSKIKLHDEDLLCLSEREMRKVRGGNIGMIFQDPMTSLNPVLTIGAQISEVLEIHRNLKGRECYIETLRLLESVQMPSPVRQYTLYPHELSGGMQQRAMIAMALAGKPALLIADEPTTALDVTTQSQILKLLKEIQQHENMAMLFISHDLAIASQMANKIAVMRKGQIIEQNSCSQFFKAPQQEYSQRLLQSVPSMFAVQPEHLQAAPAILEVKDLKVHFPIKSGVLRRTKGYVKAVDGVSFTLQPGETLAIVGESGCGKTTLGKAILSLIPVTNGAVVFAGTNLGKLRPKQWLPFRGDLQIVFQDPFASLDPKRRIIDSLEEGLLALNKGGNLQQRYELLDELLTQVGLSPDHKFRYPHEFSGGERQRLCIARALTVKPKIIVCDEPTSSLDVSVQAQVLKLLRDLQRIHNVAFVFISHDLKVVSMLAHRVAIMKNGKIIEVGFTEQVMRNPQHEYTKQLLAAVPMLQIN